MKERAIGELVTPIAEDLGLEVDRIEVMRAGKRMLLRITLDGDGPRGLGPSLDDISAATRAISDALDSSDATGDRPYTLEVSSRGVSTPLTEPKHFRRNRTRLVALTLASGEAVTGRITGASDALELDVDGETRSFDFSDIVKAVVQVEFNRPLDQDADSGEE
jgi:ribosome maturation factor RimP